MEITIDTPKLPALPPLPDGIEIPDTAEELFPEEPVTVILYGKRKWITSRVEVARKEILMRVPGKGVCEFVGPLEPVHAVAAEFHGRECGLVCTDRSLPLPRLKAGAGWAFTVHLRG